MPSITRITLGSFTRELLNPTEDKLNEVVLDIVKSAEAQGISASGLRVDIIPETIVPEKGTPEYEVFVNTMLPSLADKDAHDIGSKAWFARCPQTVPPTTKGMTETQLDMLESNQSDIAQGYAVSYTPAEIRNPELLFSRGGSSNRTIMLGDAQGSSDVVQIRGGDHDVIGEIRSLNDLDLALASGFAPKPTVYRRGTRVISLGVENARKSRQQFEARPTVEDGMADFIQAIRDEGRYEKELNLIDITMGNDGRVSADGAFHNEPIEAGAFSQYAGMLAQQVGLKSFAAGLSSMQGEGPVGVSLRAHNIAMMRSALATKEACEAARIAEAKTLNPKLGTVFTPKAILARARKGGVYAFVGPNYPCFDADQVAAAISKMHAREGMRVEVNYDGASARFDIIAQTPVPPEKFVAGEFFRIGYRISTSDDGTGAIKISVLLWQNLCLNLIILDKGTIEIKSIRHRGDVAKLALELDAALVKAQAQISGFLDKWNYAAKQKITMEQVPAAPGHKYEKALTNEELMAGVFRSLIERDLVPVGARKAPEAVKALMAAWSEDTSAASMTGPTRASVVNAITRVAHDGKYNAPLDLDMDDEDLWERAGGKVLDTKTPLLWIPSKDEVKAANAAAIAALLAKAV